MNAAVSDILRTHDLLNLILSIVPDEEGPQDAIRETEFGSIGLRSFDALPFGPFGCAALEFLANEARKHGRTVFVADQLFLAGLDPGVIGEQVLRWGEGTTFHLQVGPSLFQGPIIEQKTLDTVTLGQRFHESLALPQQGGGLSGGADPVLRATRK